MILTSVIYGCDKPALVDTFSELYVRYDADIKELKAEATFFEYSDGKKGEAKVFPSGVQFINSGMRTSELPNGVIRYYAGIAGLLPRETYFTWYGKKGLPNTIKAPITKINGFEIPGDSISLSDGISIYLNTSNLKGTEKLVLSISDTNGNVKNLETKGPTATTKFSIPGRELKGLSSGEAALYVVRSNSEEFNGETYTGVVTSEYYSFQRKIKIVE